MWCSGHSHGTDLCTLLQQASCATLNGTASMSWSACLWMPFGSGTRLCSTNIQEVPSHFLFPTKSRGMSQKLTPLTIPQNLFPEPGKHTRYGDNLQHKKQTEGAPWEVFNIFPTAHGKQTIHGHGVMSYLCFLLWSPPKFAGLCFEKVPHFPKSLECWGGNWPWVPRTEINCVLGKTEDQEGLGNWNEQSQSKSIRAYLLGNANNWVYLLWEN